MENRLIVIGLLGQAKAYMNISLNETLKRYLREHEEMSVQEALKLTAIFEFEDEFEVYNAWAVESDPRLLGWGCECGYTDMNAKVVYAQQKDLRIVKFIDLTCSRCGEKKTICEGVIE